MKTGSKINSKELTVVLLIIYLAVLSWIILFKMQFNISLLKNMNFRNVNLVPFSDSLVVNGKIDVSEIILNIAVFIPFGVYMAMIFTKWGFLKKTAPIFGVSLLYEILQYVFAVGASDITDLLGNTLGGIIGIALYYILQKMFKEKTLKILNVLAAFGTVVVVLFLGILVVANM